jgi:hypothetical protein
MRDEVVRAARAARLPAAYEQRSIVEAGGLLLRSRRRCGSANPSTLSDRAVRQDRWREDAVSFARSQIDLDDRYQAVHMTASGRSGRRIARAQRLLYFPHRT